MKPEPLPPRRINGPDDLARRLREHLLDLIENHSQQHGIDLNGHIKKGRNRRNSSPQRGDLESGDASQDN